MARRDGAKGKREAACAYGTQGRSAESERGAAKRNGGNQGDCAREGDIHIDVDIHVELVLVVVLVDALGQEAMGAEVFDADARLCVQSVWGKG
jgi:hypothetical protein